LVWFTGLALSWNCGVSLPYGIPKAHGTPGLYRVDTHRDDPVNNNRFHFLFAIVLVNIGMVYRVAVEFGKRSNDWILGSARPLTGHFDAEFASFAGGCLAVAVSRYHQFSRQFGTHEAGR
jgi:hypothetical protein